MMLRFYAYRMNAEAKQEELRLMVGYVEDYTLRFTPHLCHESAGNGIAISCRRRVLLYPWPHRLNACCKPWKRCTTLLVLQSHHVQPGVPV